MENQKKKNTARKIEYKNKEAFYIIIRGVEVGIFAGLISVLYRFLLTYAEKGLMVVIDYVKGNPVKTTLWLMFLAILGAVISKMNDLVPMASGSGIPQINGEIKGHLSANWWQVILAKLFGGTLSVFAGLSLGREGPSVQLGGMAAKGVAKITKADKTTELRMISCGAGAGMAAAFNAPLAGTMFVLEEIHHSFDKNILFMGIVSTVTADYTSKLFFGQSTIFNYQTIDFPLFQYWILIIMGVVLGLCGSFYNVFMLKLQSIYKKATILPTGLKLSLVFALSGIVGILLPQITCGGHSMVEFLLNERPTIGVMLLLLFAKFIFGAICFSSSAPGGTLYPLCILGTYIGAIFGTAAINTLHLDATLWEEFVVLGMAGLFSSIVRAPITGIVLVFELTGNMNNLLPLAVVSLFSYATSSLLGTHPFYEALVSRVVESNTDKKPKFNHKSEKIIKEYVIPIGSKLDGKQIKDINWGKHVLIVSVERGESSITPNGNVELHAGDEIIFLISQRRLGNDIEYLERLFHNA